MSDTTVSDYNPDLPGLSPGLGQAPAPAPAPDTRPAAVQEQELTTALFHTQNSFGSVINRLSRGSYAAVPGYNPIDDLKSWDDGDYLRMHGQAFLGSQSPQESQAIRAEIDRGIHEREVIAASGWTGTIAGLGMQLVEPTNFLPMGNAARLAKAASAGVRAVEVGTSVAKMAVLQSSAQEALMQVSQPERTFTEGAVNVGSSTLLAAMIGAGGYRLLASEGLLDKGLQSLDRSRLKLSLHNGTMETGETVAAGVDPAQTGPTGNIADPVLSPVAPKLPTHIGEIDPNSKVELGAVFRGTEGGATTEVAANRSGLGDLGEGVYVTHDKGLAGSYGGGPTASLAKGTRKVHSFDAGSLYPEDVAYVFGGKKVGEDVQLVSGNGIPLWEGPWSGANIENALKDSGIKAVVGTPDSIGVNQIAIRDPSILKPAFPEAPRQAAAAGAAVSDTRNLSPVPYGLDSIPGVGYAVSKMFPNLDVLTNAVQPAKAALAEMVDTPIALKANVEGQTATRFGGPTIERELKQQREGLHWQIDQEMLRQWGMHLDQGAGGATFIQRQTGLAPAGKMSFDDFNGAVYDALSTGDTHAIPQVQQAAQWIRKNALDPIKERALANIEGFKETSSRPGESYAPRNWDKDKISAHWNDFVDAWTNHLEAEQRTRAQAQERMSVAQGAMESHRVTIDKLESRIEKLSADADVIAARQEETTRINKAANRRAEALRTREQDILPLRNAEGGAIFETLARNRGNLLADRASAKLSELESLQQKLATEIENHNAMRTKLESEIAAWDGKSATEAKSALKARAEAEKAREAAKAAGTYQGRDERLTSADRAVDSAVAQILKSERTLERQELKSRAEEIASRVIGTPEGRLPYDTGSTTGAVGPGNDELRGHAAHREIDIPYDMAKPWLRRSATEALKSYTHSVLPDALLAERFYGDPNLTAVMKEIESAYAAKRAAATTEAEQTQLKSQMDADIKNVAAMRDRIRGTFAYDPTMQGLAKFSQNALKVNNIISSHGMAVSSLPDFAGVVFRHGLGSAFADAWIPFAHAMMDNEAWQAVKAAGDEWKAFGIGIETHSASRNHALSDIAEHYRPTSKFERALTWASDKAFVANLLAPLTDIQKRMATNAVASNILRASEAVAGGTATAEQIQRLAEGNITQAQAARIWQQWSNNGGERVSGIILPNMANWTDQAAAKAFRGAVGRDVDIAVVQPGYGEKPKFMSRPGYNILAQYKNFTMSATQRILIANLQRHDASTMAGLVTAIGMGMLSYRINTLASGQKASDRIQDWVKEGVSRGGVLGVIDDSNSIVSKATGGKADIYRLIGADKPLSKYVSTDAAAMFLGPSYGKLTNFMKVTRGATHPSEWNEADTHAARMMTLGTNFPYLPRLFDMVEQGFNHAFGIPMKARPQ